MHAVRERQQIIAVPNQSSMREVKRCRSGCSRSHRAASLAAVSNKRLNTDNRMRCVKNHVQEFVQEVQELRGIREATFRTFSKQF
jgi:hypothetical protein